MNIVVLGFNHHNTPVEVRERVAIPSGERSKTCEALIDGGIVSEAVVLSTCNRTELFLGAENPDAACDLAKSVLTKRLGSTLAERLEPSLFEARDLAAVQHLFEVATSLDSLVIGEPHIIGQLHDDFDRARRAGTVGKVLGRLFLRAFELSKAVRKQTSIGESPVSVSSIALDLAARVFGTVEGRSVLVLGAGEMGRQTAILAVHRGVKSIAVSSRTQERARELADRIGGDVHPWEQVNKAIAEVDLIIASTGAQEPVINRDQMIGIMQKRRNQPLFIIDIAVPRDVDPAIDSLYNIYRYDLDDLTGVARENEARRKDAVPQVQTMIDEALGDFKRWCTELKVVPTIVGFRDYVEEIRKTEVEAHLRKMNSLDERDRNLVEALTLSITHKVLHQPTVRLKEAAAVGTDTRHAGSLRYLFNLESMDTIAPFMGFEKDDDDEQ
ncbi:MAG: glutamyl-tRNA reductase [Proteobacteria bacterium]|nr:glutamyl-tRNA reductase [Pseudomonadota bacterium]